MDDFDQNILNGRLWQSHEMNYNILFDSLVIEDLLFKEKKIRQYLLWIKSFLFLVVIFSSNYRLSMDR